MIKKAHFFFITLLLVLFCAIDTNAQKSESDLKKQAEKLFSSGDYLGASAMYSELVSIYPKDATFNYKYGACALYSEADKSKSLKYLEYAAKSPGVNEEAFYFLGKSYHLNNRFDEAIAAFEKYKKLARQADIERFQVDRQIEMCNNGKKLFTQSVNLDIADQRELIISALYSGYDLASFGGKVLATPAEFKSKIDKKKLENSTIYLSKENFTVYFSSYGETGASKKDIYKIIQLPSAEWSKPENLGSKINTPYDEDYPFIHVDGKTLYFSSEGHNSMGGLDIFKAEFNEQNNTWSEPENMGYPINSTGDDIFYAAGNADAEFGYFASNRETMTGKVIVYKIRLKKELAAFATIKGKFQSVDKPDLKTVKISIFNLENNELLGTYTSNPTSSDYLIKIPPGGRYNFVVEADGYLPHSESLVIPPQSEQLTLRQEIKLKKDTSGEEMSMRNYIEPPSGEEVAEKDKPQETTSKFAYEPGYKDKLKAVEIAGKTVYVIPAGPEVAFTETKSSVTANVKEPSKNEANKTDLKGDISNNDIVKIAYEDAKEVENEAINLKRDAEIATEIAVQRDSLAKAKGQESQQAMVNAQKLTNAEEKQKALAQAKELEDEANKMAKEAEVANQMAQDLTAEANSKKQEADSSYANAKVLDASIRNNDKSGSLAATNRIKNSRTKTTAKSTRTKRPVNAQLAEKHDQAKSEEKYSNQLKKESDLLLERSAALKTSASTAKTDRERDSLLKEASNLEGIAADKLKNADQYQTTSKQLQDSVKTAEIIATISAQAKNGVSSKDSANNSVVAKADESLKRPSVIDTLKPGTNATAGTQQPAISNKDTSIAAATQVKIPAQEIKLSDPKELNPSDPNYSAYSALYSGAIKDKQSADSALTASKKSKAESDSLFAKYDTDKATATAIKKKKLQQEALTKAAVTEVFAKEKGIESDTSLSRSERYLAESVRKQTEANKLLASIGKASEGVTPSVETKAATGSSKKDVNAIAQVNTSETKSDTLKTQVTTATSDKATANVNPTVSAKDTLTKYEALDIEAKKQQALADASVDQALLANNDAKTAAKEAAAERADAEKTKNKKEKQLRLAKANELDAIQKRKQAQADSLSLTSKSLIESARAKRQEAEALQPVVASTQVAPKTETQPEKQADSAATTNVKEPDLAPVASARVSRKTETTETATSPNVSQTEPTTSSQDVKAKTDTASGVAATVPPEKKHVPVAQVQTRKDPKTGAAVLDKYDPNYSKYRLLDADAKEKKRLAEQASSQASVARKDADLNYDLALKEREAAENTKKKKDKQLRIARADSISAKSKASQLVADSLQIASVKLSEEAKQKQSEADAMIPAVAQVSAEASNPIAAETNSQPKSTESENKNTAVQGQQTGTSPGGDTTKTSDTKYLALMAQTAKLKKEADENSNEAALLERESKRDSLQAITAYADAKKSGNDLAREIAMKKAKALDSGAKEKDKLSKEKFAKSKSLSKEAVLKEAEATSLKSGVATSVVAINTPPAQEKASETEAPKVEQPKQPEPKQPEPEQPPVSTKTPEPTKAPNVAINSIFGATSESVYSESNPIPMNVPLPEGLIFKVQIGAFKNPIPQNTFKGIQPITGEKTGNGLTRYTAGLFIAFETANLVKKEIRSRGYNDAFLVAFYRGKRIPLYEAADVVRSYSNAQKIARKNAIREELAVLKSNDIYPEKYGADQADADLAAYTGQAVAAGTTDNTGIQGTTKQVATTNSLNYDGLVYTVQVGVYKSPNVPAKFRNVKPINRDQLANGTYRYTSGVYNFLNSADSARRSIAAGGVKDAFVIVLFRGQRITPEEGRRRERTITPVAIDKAKVFGIGNGQTENTQSVATPSGEITYKIQVGAFKNEVPFTMVDAFLKLKDQGISNVKRNGLVVYYVGSVKDFTSAEKLREEVVNMGLKDAFTVAFEGDKQIPVKEAISKSGQ